MKILLPLEITVQDWLPGHTWNSLNLTAFIEAGNLNVNWFEKIICAMQ